MRQLLPILLLGIAFSPAAHAQSTQEAMSIDNAIQELSKLANAADPASHLRGATSFVSYHGNGKETTKGSRLLFDAWPKGFVIGVYDTVMNNPDLFLNYDKMTHDLYFTFDGKTIIKAETSQAREIHFTTGEGAPITLTRVDGIDPRQFFQRMSDSAGVHNYILYRLVSTQYRRANFQTNGLTSTGNNFDEYIDDYDYFIVMPGGKLYADVKLKKNSIRAALGDKADPWFRTHTNEKTDEAFLIGLVNNLNRAH